MQLFQRGLQKFYSKSIGGRDYHTFEAMQIGLGLPLVFPLLPVETLNTSGARAVKTGKALETAHAFGLPLTWDSRVDKFDKRRPASSWLAWKACAERAQAWRRGTAGARCQGADDSQRLPV